MASNGHTQDSSSSPISEYENWKQCIIDIEDKAEDLNITDCNIYKVPCNLRNSNKEAYTPQVVSIGPIHHRLENLIPMREQKVRYLKLFWSQVVHKTEAMDKFKSFLEACDGDKAAKGKNIRKCYAKNICDNIKKDKLVEMMLLDSGFIMELFLRIQSQKSAAAAAVEKEGKHEQEQEDSMKKNSDDIILKQSWLNKSIQRDLLLLENQIPFFILEELYEECVPDSRKKKDHPTFIELASDYFDCYRTNEKCHEEKKSSSGFAQLDMNCGSHKKGDSPSGEKTGSSDCKGNSPKHFTDLIRSFYICKNLKIFKNSKPLKTATKLRESGVSFVKVDGKPLLDIKFQKIRPLSWFLCLGCFPKSTYFKARLQIPELKVGYTTECVLRNLIAFEQCHYPEQPYICNYVSFIDSLIHTKDDVELLVEKEVIMHELGSDKEVATLVNGLCKYVVTDKTCYADKIDSLDKHYQNQWNRTMAALRLVYFKDTWRASSTLVATAVLIFTIFNFCRVVRLVLDLEGAKKP